MINRQTEASSLKLFVLADALASVLLDGKTDKQGVPLIFHCRSVYKRCSHLSDEQRIAALLHDCIEDGKVPYSKQIVFGSDISVYALIECLFGETVAGLVAVLSRNMHTTEDAQGNCGLLPYEEYILEVAQDQDAIPIKLADIDDNLNEDGLRSPVKDQCEWKRLQARYLAARTVLRSALR